MYSSQTNKSWSAVMDVVVVRRLSKTDSSNKHPPLRHSGSPSHFSSSDCTFRTVHFRASPLMFNTSKTLLSFPSSSTGPLGRGKLEHRRERGDSSEHSELMSCKRCCVEAASSLVSSRSEAQEVECRFSKGVTRKIACEM